MQSYTLCGIILCVIYLNGWYGSGGPVGMIASDLRKHWEQDRRQYKRKGLECLTDHTRIQNFHQRKSVHGELSGGGRNGNENERGRQR